jgi:predicted permease
MNDLQWIALAAAVVALGMAALGWMRPRRVGLTSAQVMLLLGAAGMLAGLVVDSRTTPLALIANICGQAERDLWAMTKLHAALLPWMHVGMWVGGFLAVPLLRTLRPTCRRQYCARVVQNLACSAWMTAGMSAGVLAASALASQGVPRGAVQMLAGMAAGMVWGMVVSVALYRLFFLVVHTTPRPVPAHPDA